MLKNEKLIYLGVIIGAHGIKGHVRVRSFTNNSKTIASLPLQDEKGQELHMKFIREGNKEIICSITGVNDRNTSELYKGTKLYTRRDNLPDLEMSEYYIEDLISMEVRSEKGAVLGSVVAVYNFGAGDLIEILDLERKTEIYPFTQEFFPEIHEDFLTLIKNNY